VEAAAKAGKGGSAAAVATVATAERNERRLVISTPRSRERLAMMLEPHGNFRKRQDAGRVQ
jgi:shikimate 5-dehydrogenase